MVLMTMVIFMMMLLTMMAANDDVHVISCLVLSCQVMTEHDAEKMNKDSCGSELMQ